MPWPSNSGWSDVGRPVSDLTTLLQYPELLDDARGVLARLVPVESEVGLPDGRWLVTERPGRLRIITADGVTGEPVAGLPAVDARGQGGLLDVAVGPSIAQDRLFYWSYS